MKLISADVIDVYCLYFKFGQLKEGFMELDFIVYTIDHNISPNFSSMLVTRQ